MVLVICRLSALVIVFGLMTLVPETGLAPNAAHVPLILFPVIVFPSDPAGRRIAVWVSFIVFPVIVPLVSARKIPMNEASEMVLFWT